MTPRAEKPIPQRAWRRADAIPPDERIEKGLAMRAPAMRSTSSREKSCAAFYRSGPKSIYGAVVRWLSVVRDSACRSFSTNSRRFSRELDLPEYARPQRFRHWLGPGPEAAVIDLQIMLLPLSAFDSTGHRIGYGAGHYDQAIAPPALKKGLNPRLIGIAPELPGSAISTG